jgi:tRNA (guanine-N7-)-methyltransferase
LRRTPRLPLEALAPYLLDAPSPPASKKVSGTFSGNPEKVPDTFFDADTVFDPLDWSAVFGNDRPVELEVGFGKGLFLITSATARPDVNFAGIEIVRKYQLFTATRLAKRELKNVRVACADARLFLRDGVPSASLQTVHVYFPDPWWKKRHHKRRVFTEEFAHQGLRILRPGGELSAATDVQEYSVVMAQTMASLPEFQPVPPPEPGSPVHDLDYLTNFERKFRKQGKPIYRLRYVKSVVSPSRAQRPGVSGSDKSSLAPALEGWQ